MSRQQLLAYPHIEEIIYRSKIDPYKINLMLRSIDESVLRCLLRGSESQDLHKDLRLGVNASYLGLASQASQFLMLQSLQAGVAVASSFDNVNTLNGGKVDSVGGVTTLSWDTKRHVTKIPRYDTDNDGIADHVSPAVVMIVDNEVRTPDNKAYNCLNRSNRSFWIEEAAAGDHTIEIQLPPSINKAFNYIELAPFPAFGMKIKRIEYQDIYSNWQTLFHNEDKQYKFYNDSGPLVMHFSPKETNGTFKITVTALSGVDVIGFSSIDIARIDYEDRSQTVYLRFNNLKGPKTVNLSSINVDFYIDHETLNYGDFITELALTNIADPLTETKVMISKATHETYYFSGDSLTLGSGEHMHFKVIMKENNMTTPVIRGCKLTY